MVTQPQLFSDWQPILTTCPALLPDRRGQRHTFFEAILVAHQYLQNALPIPDFLEAMIAWTGRSVDKSDFYKQHILYSFYLVGVIPYTKVQQAGDYRLVSELPITTIKSNAESLLKLRSYCLTCFNQRLERMTDIWQIMPTIAPFPQTRLTEKFDEIELATRDEVKKRIRVLVSLGALERKKGLYYLTPLSQKFIPEVSYNSPVNAEIHELPLSYQLDNYEFFDLW